MAEAEDETRIEEAPSEYSAFTDREFTVKECGKLLNQRSSSASFHLNNFSAKGILRTHRHPGRAYTYTFTVTPTDNPECFALTDAKQTAERMPMITAQVNGQRLLAAAG